MTLEPKPNGGLKRDEETHSRTKKPKKKKKPDEDDDGDDGDVETDRLDISVNWDPWKQKWISTILVRIRIPFGEPETVVFERETELFPPDMDVPNTINDSTQHPDDDDFFQEVEGTLSSNKSTYEAGVVVFGHALGTDIIPTAKDKIYGWKSDTYMLQSWTRKNVAIAYNGALLSGAQLNVITGTHNYDTSTLYEVSNLKYVDYVLNGDQVTYDPVYTNIHDFVNRNRDEPGKKSEWTPSSVQVTLDVLVTSSEDRSKFFENVFMTNYEDQVLQSVVDDPENWRIVNNYNETMVASLMNNYDKYNSMRNLPYSLRLMAATSINRPAIHRIDWLQTLSNR